MRFRDLNYYVSACRLPKMPIAQQLPSTGHKSHANKLQIVPGEWRRLEGIQPMPTAGLIRNVTKWTDGYLPKNDTDLLPNERPTIPCPVLVGFALTDAERLGVPNTTSELVPWIIHLPIQTVQCVLHAVFPETRNYSFSLYNDPQNLDGDLFQSLSWMRDGEDVDPDPRLVLAIQPPWILSDKDIAMFSKSRAFPPYKKSGHMFPQQAELASEHRVWGKVYDLCVKRRTRWFVLTSYNSWVFGAFSEGWTFGFVTDVFRRDAYGPTIAQMLMFWIASAMQMKDTVCVPKVPEPVAHIFVPLVIPDQKACIEFKSVTGSESHWDGKSDDAPSSAGVEISDVGSIVSGMMGGPPADTIQYGVMVRQGPLENWLKDQSRSVALPPDALQLEQIVKKVQHAPLEAHLGDWMI